MKYRPKTMTAFSFWSAVTAAVSALKPPAWKKGRGGPGSFIYLQLGALGRAADPNALKEELGADVVSSSDLAFEGGAKPRALTKEEIKVRFEFRAHEKDEHSGVDARYAGVRRLLRPRGQELR